MAYVDKELIDKLKHTCIAKYPLSYIDGIFAFAKEIAEMPEADVAEVKHGHWIEDIQDILPLNGIVPMKALVGYRCSVCNRPEFLKEPYCNCGTKLNGRS